MLHWKILSRSAERTHVLLYGDITEAVSFGELVQLRGRVLFDLAGVRRINSFGVRELLTLLETLQPRCQLEGERCSTAVVMQLNMLPELSKKLQVRSVLVPMECTRCTHEQEIAVDMPAGVRVPSLPPTRCDRCKSAMQPSEPSDRYFAFTDD
jgi:hypothetical protein